MWPCTWKQYLPGWALLFSFWVWLTYALVSQIELIDKDTVVTPPRIARMAVNQPLVAARPPPPLGAVGPVGLPSVIHSALTANAAPLPAIVGQRKLIVKTRAVSINTVFATRIRHLREPLRRTILDLCWGVYHTTMTSMIAWREMLLR